jgi:putative transposase
MNAKAELLLNPAGEMIKFWWESLPSKFLNISLGEFVVMPDHFHGILIINQQTQTSIFEIIQWFKTMTTNAYIKGVKERGWKVFNKKLWQRNYYEQIIRDARAFQNISNYIIENPIRHYYKRKFSNWL